MIESYKTWILNTLSRVVVSDPYKGMSVAYNFLNLPRQMLWSDAGGAEKIIDFLYDAKGRKLRKTVTDNTTLLYRQDYAGSLEYRFTTSNGLQPEAVYFGDGRVAFIENYRRYEYYLKDHLGNIRLTFTDKNNNGVVDVNNTANNEILQVERKRNPVPKVGKNHYYPFGMDQSGPWMNDAALDNAYKYNGIERNTDFGMNLDLAFFRSYDASLARWWQVDPKPAYIHNPYMGMGNNPMINSDPLGDTLRGVDARSARRAQSIIQSSFGKGKASEASASLFTVGKDGKTFNQISRKEFRKATKGLTSSQKSMALGYYKAANSKTTHVVEAVKRNESISAYGKSHLIGDIKTGADIDRGDYGGFTYPGSADSSPGINNAVDGNATYSILVTDAQSIITGLKFPSSAGELLSHELLGHAMARSLGIHLDCLEAIRATNLFMYANPRVDGRTQLRRDHGVGEIGNGDPLSPPSYLKDMDGVSFPGN